MAINFLEPSLYLGLPQSVTSAVINLK